MKNFNLICMMIILGIISTSTLAISPDSTIVNQQNETDRDVLNSISARVIEGNIYFNLTITNESKPGVYSLVKTYSDGTFESVGIKDIVVNEINKPLLYSFVENNKPDVNVTYELIRISLDVETVETWGYCPIKDKVSVREVLAVDNE